MADIGKPKPQFFKFVPKPKNVGNAELSRARPVYIADLPEAGTPEVTLAMYNALVERIETLEGSEGDG